MIQTSSLLLMVRPLTIEKKLWENLRVHKPVTFSYLVTSLPLFEWPFVVRGWPLWIPQDPRGIDRFLNTTKVYRHTDHVEVDQECFFKVETLFANSITTWLIKPFTSPFLSPLHPPADRHLDRQIQKSEHIMAYEKSSKKDTGCDLSISIEWKYWLWPWVYRLERYWL